MNRKNLKAFASKLQSRSVAFIASAMAHHYPPAKMAYTLPSRSGKVEQNTNNNNNNNNNTNGQTATALASSASTRLTRPKDLYSQPNNYAKLVWDAFCSGKPVSCVCLPMKGDRLRAHLQGPYPTTHGTQFRADDIEYVIHLLEGMSRCETCLRELPSMAQLHGLSTETIERSRLFYQSLHQAFVGSAELQIDMYYCSFAVEQMERMAASIGRIIAAASAEPRFDRDAWYVVLNQAERLMKAATTLQERVEQAARF